MIKKLSAFVILLFAVICFSACATKEPEQPTPSDDTVVIKLKCSDNYKPLRLSKGQTKTIRISQMLSVERDGSYYSSVEVSDLRSVKVAEKSIATCSVVNDSLQFYGVDYGVTSVYINIRYTERYSYYSTYDWTVAIDIVVRDGILTISNIKAVAVGTTAKIELTELKLGTTYDFVGFSPTDKGADMEVDIVEHGYIERVSLTAPRFKVVGFGGGKITLKSKINKDQIYKTEYVTSFNDSSIKEQI